MSPTAKPSAGSFLWKGIIVLGSRDIQGGLTRHRLSAETILTHGSIVYCYSGSHTLAHSEGRAMLSLLHSAVPSVHEAAVFVYDIYSELCVLSNKIVMGTWSIGSFRIMTGLRSKHFASCILLLFLVCPVTELCYNCICFHPIVSCVLRQTAL